MRIARRALVLFCFVKSLNILFINQCSPSSLFKLGAFLYPLFNVYTVVCWHAWEGRKDWRGMKSFLTASATQEQTHRHICVSGLTRYVNTVFPKVFARFGNLFKVLVIQKKKFSAHCLPSCLPCVQHDRYGMELIIACTAIVALLPGFRALCSID